MPDHFYRFRSIKTLLGPFDEPNGQFDELARQEIYFARPSELNDPMEGFKNISWRGDEIVWRNLLQHYLYCLMQSSYLFGVLGAKFTVSACDKVIHQTRDDLPEAPVREIYKEICDSFFAHQVPNNLVSALSIRKAAVGRDELSYYLRALNPLVVSVVQNAIGRRVAAGEHLDPTPEAKRALDGLDKLLKHHPGYEGMSEALFAVSELTFMQTNLIQDFGIERTVEQAGSVFLVRDFPTYYVESLERLIYPDWHAACFVADPANASVWSSYGDSHRGVCLKFSASAAPKGFRTLSLYRAHGWSASRNGGERMHYAYVPHPFEEVRYTHEYPEIDFFGSLGTVPMGKLMRFWYAGPAGTLSASSDNMLKNEEEWRRRYWDTFRISSTSKTSDWAHEREYRLILTSNLQRFDDAAASRKLKYKFSDLAGIAFGIKTTTADKLRIMKIIDQKCLSEGRTDFEFYQARYSRQAKKIELAPLRLLKITR